MFLGEVFLDELLLDELSQDELFRDCVGHGKILELLGPFLGCCRWELRLKGDQ